MNATDSRGLRRFVSAVFAAAPAKAAASAALLVASSLMEGVGVLLLVPLLALVGVDAGGGPLSRGVALFSSALAAVGVRPTLPVVLLIYVALAALQSVIQRWQAMLDVAVQHEFVRGLRERVYRAMAGAQWVFLSRNRSSDAFHVLTQEIDRVRSAVFYLTSFLVGAVIALVYFALALRVSATVTGLVVGCGVVLAWTVRDKITRARTLGQAWSQATKRLYAAMTEHLASMKTAKSYGIAARHADVFGQLLNEERDVQWQTTRALADMRQRLALGVPAVLAVVVYVSYGMLKVPTAQLLLLLFMFARLMPRLTGLYENLQAFAVSWPALEAVTAFEAQCLAAREPAATAHEPIVLRDRIRFDGVSFAYRDAAAAPAVDQVNLEIVAGHTTAVVGPSGSGKSTLVDLLTGLLTPRQGRILVDGLPLSPERLNAWRDQIGCVPQDAFLFHDTVRANLLWARPGASDDDLWRALESAAAADFVGALPEGLDTLVGDRGLLLSGGERQRLALARALVRKPALLILDEATSSLDSENEVRIQDAIDDLHQQVTIVIITHRLSTVRGADLIHVIDRGRLVESGSWQALAARENGRFRELCLAQGVDVVGSRALGVEIVQ